MLNILLIVFDKIHFTELIVLAKALKKQPGMQVTICITETYEGILADIAACKHEDLSCINEHAEELEMSSVSVSPRGSPSRLSRVAQWILRRSLVAAIINSIKNKRVISELLKKCHPNAVIMSEDHVENVSGFIIAAAKKLSIPAFIVPYTFCTSSEAAQYYYNNSMHRVHGWFRSFIARRYPHWVLDFQDRKLFRLPVAGILAREWTGIYTSTPWVPNSGPSDGLLVEGEALRQYWIKAGIPSTNVFSTGSPILDLMYEEILDAKNRRNAILKELGLSDRRRILIFAMPFDAIQLRKNHCEFSSFHEMSLFFCEMFERMENYNIIIRPHPRIRRGSIDVSRYSNIRVSDRPTFELIPHGDIFIAAGSATIRWALACGKTVINYDVYGYEYADFAAYSEVETVRTKEQFASSLARHSTVPTGKGIDLCSIWGVLDGKAVERIAGKLAEVNGSLGVKK